MTALAIAVGSSACRSTENTAASEERPTTTLPRLPHGVHVVQDFPAPPDLSTCIENINLSPRIHARDSVLTDAFTINPQQGMNADQYEAFANGQNGLLKLKQSSVAGEILREVIIPLDAIPAGKGAIVEFDDSAEDVKAYLVASHAPIGEGERAHVVARLCKIEAQAVTA